MPKKKQHELGFSRQDKTDLVRESDLLGGLIRPTLRETRRIAIGKKGDKAYKKNGGEGTFRLPVQLDYFIISLKTRDEKDDFILDEAMHRKLGQKPREVPIEFLYDRPGLNVHVRLALYAGRTAWCAGNGKEALRLDEKTDERVPIKCPCDLLTEGKCKPHLVLTGQLPGMRVGEVAKFRTTSKRSISYILSGMKRIMEVTAQAVGLPWQKGPLAELPLILTLEKETVIDREGKTRVIPTVGISFNGTKEQLQKLARARLKEDRDASRYLQSLEIERKQEVAEQPTLLAPESPHEVEAIVEEFYPHAVDNVTSIEKIPAPGNPEAAAKVKKQEKKEAEEILREQGLPDALRQALSSVDDDLLGEGDGPPAPPREKPPMRRQAPPPPPPKKQKPKDESFL